ncbi:uncharacterized protein LOC117120816 [Anneissia japonica]|uniref:uncharacterized protein LOC117120816 n=1 Tax=Anneissia japonica TaxID=1529436 RepID=UPI001425A832|nr:uncharacterized protein LOC117120816 [Anneissia japonica]
MQVLIILTLLLSAFRCLLSQSAFTSSPSDAVSVVDGNVTLQCSVNSISPGDLLQWYKDGDGYVTQGITTFPPWVQRAHIEGDSAAYNRGQYNLVISRLQESDAGAYRCIYTAVGTNPIGTRAAIVTVLHQPNCSQNPMPVGINEVVELTCTTDDLVVNSDIDSYTQWTLNGVLLSMDATFRKTLSGNDNYETYICEAVITGHPDIVRTCSIVPLAIPPSARISPSGTVVMNKGSMMNFTCFSIAFPHIASIDWLINEESVINYLDVFEYMFSTDRSNFAITIKTAEDVTRYYNINCRVYDPKGYIGDSTPTTIMVEPMVTVATLPAMPSLPAVIHTTTSLPTLTSVKYTVSSSVSLVTFIKTPSDTNTTAGSVIVLECAVNHLGDGEMKWFKVETGAYIMIGLQASISASEDIQTRYSIVGGKDAYNRGQYSLQITNVKDSDSGTYFCSYSSADSTSFSSNYAELMLLSALVCQQSPDHALPPGTMVSMQCMVEDQRERTTVTWSNDLGIQLTIAEINKVTYTLILQPTDNFRVFTCAAVSDNDDIARTCNLIPLAIQPVVKITEESTEVSGGLAVNFTCQAEAEPYVSSYEWLIDGMELDTFNETFEINVINSEVLELVAINNGENTAIYNITCTVYIPSGHSVTSDGVALLVSDRGYKSFVTMHNDTITVVTVIVISLLGVIVLIVIILLCYLKFWYGRRRELSLKGSISFSQQAVTGERYGTRPSVQIHHIDAFRGAEAIYALPVKVRNGKKAAKKATKASRESVYENSAESDKQVKSVSRPTSEYMNFNHENKEVIQPVGFPNFGYCPDSPTSSRLDISTLPTKPTVAPRPEIKRLSSFEPLPDVCNARQSGCFELPFNATLEEENQNIDRVQTDELIYSNEPVHHVRRQIYDDFDSDSFDSDSEDETHM